jgi:hypothetical protein
MVMLITVAVVLAQSADEDIARYIRALESEAVEERDAAAEKLVQVGERAVPSLEAARKSAGPDASRRIAAVLERIRARIDERETLARIAALPETSASRTYRVTGKGQPSRKVVLKTTKDGDGILLEDVEVWEHDGKASSHRYTQACSIHRFLQARKVRSVYSGQENEPLEGEIKDGTARITLEGVTQTLAVSDRACTPAALLRIVGALPQRKDVSLVVDHFNVLGARVTTDTTLRCAGEEEIDLHDKRVRAWKWEHTGKTLKDHAYWVRDGVTIRAALYAGTQDWVIEK